MKFAIAIVSLLIPILASSAVSQNIVVVRYPGQPMENLITKLLERTGIDADIQVHPWARNYRMALDEENVLIGPFLKTAEREHLFKWLDVPIFSSRGFLYKLKERRDIKVNSLDEAKEYQIGKAKNYALPKFLIENGFDSTLELAVTEESNFKKLLARRIDLVVMYEKNLENKLRELGIDKDLIVPEYQLYSLDAYLAFSKTTPDTMVQLFNKHLVELERDGTLAKLKKTVE